MTKKQLRRAIIRYQNKTGVNKYDARRIVEASCEDQKAS